MLANLSYHTLQAVEKSLPNVLQWNMVVFFFFKWTYVKNSRIFSSHLYACCLTPPNKQCRSLLAFLSLLKLIIIFIMVQLRAIYKTVWHTLKKPVLFFAVWKCCKPKPFTAIFDAASSLSDAKKFEKMGCLAGTHWVFGYQVHILGLENRIHMLGSMAGREDCKGTDWGPERDHKGGMFDNM